MINLILHIYLDTVNDKKLLFITYSTPETLLRHTMKLHHHQSYERGTFCYFHFIYVENKEENNVF